MDFETYYHTLNPCQFVGAPNCNCKLRSVKRFYSHIHIQGSQFFDYVFEIFADMIEIHIMASLILCFDSL